MTMGAIHDYSALRGLRIGCVAYLNSRPLIEPYDGEVILDHPAVLAASLVRGDLDAALVPVFEALRHPEFSIVDGVSISSRGPVWSVFAAHCGPLSAVRTVRLDPASLTSANLCKVLFAEWGSTVPDYQIDSVDPIGPPINELHPAARDHAPVPPGTARVLIGNQAIAFRQCHGAACDYLDFGEEWMRQTGLPFVFAVWLLRPETARLAQVAQAFRDLAREGKATIPVIVARHPEFSAEFATHYLTQNIQYRLGSEEKRGIARFRELLGKHGLLTTDARPLCFV